MAWGDIVSLEVEPYPAPVYGCAVYYPGRPSFPDYLDQWDHHIANVGMPGNVRTYGTSNDMVWDWTTHNGGPTGTSSPTTDGWEDRWSWHSFKGDTEAVASGSQNSQITDSVGTIPVTGNKRMLTFFHEPENDVLVPANPSLGLQPMDWINAQIQFCNAVKAADHPDVLVGPCMMTWWYISGVALSNPRNIETWMLNAESIGLTEPFADAVDFVGWDPYHAGSVKGKITGVHLNPAFYVDNGPVTGPGAPFGVLHWMNKWFPKARFAIGETGYVPQAPPNENTRGDWLISLDTYLRDLNTLTCCYWDAQVAGLPEYYYLTLKADGASFDAYTSSVWGDLYP